MGNLIQIKTNHKININKKVLNFLNPDYIYIPYPDGFKLNFKSNDLVKKEEVVLANEKEYLYSPVSGKVLGAVTMQVGKDKAKTIIIENDFKEETKSVKGVKKQINSYTKVDVKTLVKTFNAYQGEFNGTTMVISGIDTEPYALSSSYLVSEYTNEILETIDALYEIFGINKCIFAIKNNDSENATNLVNYLGTYPQINLKLMPDLYPLGLPEILIKELGLNQTLEEIIYLTVEDIYAIYSVLKKGRPLTEKLVTISGDLLTRSKVVKVKIGTSLKDLLLNNFKIKVDLYHVVINGILGQGYEIDNLDFVITPDVKSIFITSIDESKEKTCINCGMCHTKCPVSCDPRQQKLKGCINCGSCTYICPAKINFKERVR